MSNWLKRFLEIKDPIMTVKIPEPEVKKMPEEQKVYVNPESPGFKQLEAESQHNPVPPRDPATSIATPYGLVARTAARTLGSLTLDEAEVFFAHILGQAQQPAAKPQLSAEEQAKRIQAAIAAALQQ